MFELIDTQPPITIQQSEFKRLLGLPQDRELDGRILELATWAEEWYRENGKPWIYARQEDDIQLTGGDLRINSASFSPGRLSDRLGQAQSESVMLVAISAGRECEEEARKLWADGKPDEYFFLEVYGSAVVEHLVAVASFRLCEWADQHSAAILPHYSPGYPGWDIRDQTKLLELILKHQGAKFHEHLSAMETGMLQPKKSLLAVFGITNRLDLVPRLTELVPCENCSLPSCRYRRAPQKYPLPQLENVRRLQSGGNGGSVNDVSRRKFTVNPRALQKWTEERLSIESLADRSILARFRYDGTTCSNLGRPLAFEYHVKVGSQDRGYPILEAGCEPVAGNDGHTHMCEYIKNAQSLMKSITVEKPLVGKPLDDVFAWQRNYSPAGCYCTQESRDHKWGIVFEVLRYALEKRKNGG
ncbi:MAG: hypothetical protein WBD36_01675 [Bacteroidota bacterium]